MSSEVIKSVNWHLTSACNYSCRFCFARNLHECPLPFKEGTLLIDKLSKMGMEKINFAGVEPLLHPNLFDYCKYAKGLGMTVSVTTNGFLINEQNIMKMKGCVDWISISVDSSLDTIEKQIGHGNKNYITNCLSMAAKIEEADINLEINTVVTSLTYQENMYPLINTLNPEYWKVSQITDLDDMNSCSSNNFSLTKDQFRFFIERHKNIVLNNGNSPVFEYADDMRDSCFVLTPSGYVMLITGRKIQFLSLEAVLNYGLDNFVSSDN